MCGFVGFTNQIRDNGTILLEMMDKIAHRGPDSQGRFLDENIAMGFRRLSIIDLHDGNQPMLNEDGRLVLTFNGEIYNYRELREELISLGHIFKTHSDSEVILHGFEQFGTEITQKLRGMFSFVIYDREEHSLFGARDIFGIKPFYYTMMNDSFIYGSEIKAFLCHPQFEKKLNEDALAHYLSFQYSPTEETFFSGVYKLPPAHYFIYKDGKLEKTRYWKPNFSSEQGAPEYYADLIDEAIRESVEAHKIADVEVGSFLSSGIDSSYIAATARVDKTFTVGFGDDSGRYSEIDYAKDFAKEVGLKNISRIITKQEYFENFPQIQYHMDEPLADPAAIALYFVAKLASEYVKVVMSGEGADELFGGYRIYREPLTATSYEAIPLPVRRIIGAVCSILPKKHGVNFLIRRGKTIEERFIGNANIFTRAERRRILLRESSMAPALLCKPFYDEVKDKDAVTKMQYLDINMWLMGDILLKADKTSMANSLELRVPFLDKKVMELAEKIPLNCRIGEGTTKLSLRKAAARSIPSRTAMKDKLGFPVPIRVWLKEDDTYNTVREAFESETAKKYFKINKLLKMLETHKNGKADLSRKIWTVYTFLVWHSKYFEV